MNVQVENLLKLKKIYHYYGKAKVLEEFNLKIENKSLNAVIGPNGVGKSTVLRLISGLESPDRGKIVFQGERIDGLKAYKITKKGISQSPDRRRLFYQLSVADNLRMGAYILKDKQQYKALREFVYEIFPRLRERRKQQAGTLSGGEQQMLAIARALMSKPVLLLLDEPSVGLAPSVKKKIFRAIKKIKQEGTTTILVEQDVHWAMEIADTINLLEEGKIAIRGTKEQLRKEPRIRKSYLGI
ncbi:MAG: High-affinity branched-chain amino acid transport ATP-binding protein LivF [Candidatus Lokiarchaeum sp. GC14_75]|nr:MAG: High-affinity branched-chain amino acid transport ATP-binding protein LivF [Candidatus Lokiarchaeum sp. GC14_75]